MRAGRPIALAIGIGISLICPPSAGAGVTISSFGDGPDGFMQGTVVVSGYGPCSGSGSDECFATYLHGYIRADDGSCPPEQGMPALSAVLPADGSTFTADVDGDPAVRGRNRLCVYVERVYWSGAATVIAEGSAVAYSRGPASERDEYECADPDLASAQRGTGPDCEERHTRVLLGPGARQRADPPWLSLAEARRAATRRLKRVFKGSFARRGLSRRCSRRTRATVACRVAWSTRAERFGGKVVVRKLGVRRYRYALRIRRVDRSGRDGMIRR